MAGYASCNADYFADNTTARYLINHANLKWVTVNVTTATSVTKRIVLNNGGTLYYGRIQLTSASGVKYTQIGKVNLNFGLVYWNGVREITAKTWEILSC
jgi:hypothetical protein